MSINVNRKGKKAERDVAKLINKTLGTNCRRTPSSGALSFKGDIIDINVDSVAHNYHFEIKNQKAIRVREWWKQTTSDCSIHKTPVLIFKMQGRFYVMKRLEDFLGNLKTIDEGEVIIKAIRKD